MRHICVPMSRLLLLLLGLAVVCHISSPNIRGQRAARKTFPSPRSTDGIEKAALAENAVDVLGGRLTVRMPQGATVDARPFPIMAASESEEHETRLVSDAGQEIAGARGP